MQWLSYRCCMGWHRTGCAQRYPETVLSGDSGSLLTMRWAMLLGAVALEAAVPCVMAQDISVSGYGTIGYSRSDQSFTYQRFIDNNGTLWRDSIAGLQADAKFANGLGATLQVKVAPARDSDNQYEPSVAWAFLSYRPTNDWLFRIGKQRLPLYLYSETVDVGVTYDFARLPPEMYSLSPINDFTAVSFSKVWETPNGDLTLDGIWGQSRNSPFRFWVRDNIPPIQQSGAVFMNEDFKGGGLAISFKRHDDIYRVSAFRVRVKFSEPFPTTYPFVSLMPNIGYYQVDNSMPGPGVPMTSSVMATVVSIGASVGLGSGFRVIGELAETHAPSSDIMTKGARGYASIQKGFDNWTPYLTYAFLRSAASTRNLYNNVNYNTVPEFIPASAQINASQRAGADFVPADDQYSWMLGTSYAFSATSKLKAEYMRTHVRDMSSAVDAPSGANIKNQNISVVSVSYNFVF
jgi:hypothetical protein